MTPMFRIVGPAPVHQAAIIKTNGGYDLRSYEAFLAEGTKEAWESLRLFGAKTMSEPPEISSCIAKIWEHHQQITPVDKKLTAYRKGAPQNQELAGLEMVIAGYTMARNCYITLLAANG